MKLPGRSELSIEQEKIFLEAPLDGVVLVSGPPGTGKTVLAILRSVLLAKTNKKFSLIMFNKVLVSYTKLALEDESLHKHVRTWHSWIYDWWWKAVGTKIPSVKKFDYDFDEALKTIMAGNVAHPENINWGHLILDEGQDFPPGFYSLAGYLLIKRSVEEGQMPSMTVLADQHQRLETDRHSNIFEIKQNLIIRDENHFILNRNFRNSYEIAAVARKFFVGNLNELPELPEDRRGKKPEIRKFMSLEEEARFIAKYARNNDDQDIGVFVPRAHDQLTLFEMLEGPLAGSGIDLQMYASRHQDWKDASKLTFGTRGSVTILTDKSCKGLEFDAVFVPSLNKYRTTGMEEEFVKMKLYVMASRARSYLAFSYSDSSQDPEILNIFPSENEGLLKWKL